MVPPIFIEVSENAENKTKPYFSRKKKKPTLAEKSLKLKKSKDRWNLIRSTRNEKKILW